MSRALRARCTALLLALGLLASGLTLAESPRVGLVLAGGGARGLAHIGVIRYLEERGVRVHAVAGTSMGAIIGGLYASGLSAAELEEVARGIDWRHAFDDTPPRDQIPFRRKVEDFDYLVGAQLRFKDGRLRLPMGAIEGQHLNFVLHDLVAHASRIRDFDQLPIPFRAVAADIVTGEAVVLARGDLALAMRASMSIPGVFTPMELEGRLLVDGGIAKNIPVDVAQSMGVDRLVVVDIGTPLAPREQLGDVLALVDQLSNIMTRSNSEAQLALMADTDVLIRPPLEAAGIGSASFDKAQDAIRLGYEAARVLDARLAALVATGEAERLAARPRLVMPRITAIRVDTDAPVSRRLIRNMISQPLGERLDSARIERDIATIYGMEEFARVDYHVSREAEGHVLHVYAKANPQGENILKLGMNWDQDSRGDSEFGLRASWHQRGLNRLGGEWYSAGELGSQSFLRSEFYQPLDTSRKLFADIGYAYSQKELNLASDGELRARAIVDRHQLEVGTGYHLGNSARLRLGAYTGTTDTDIQIGSPLLSSQSGNDGGYFTELLVDTLDRPYFPSAGTRLKSRYAKGDEGLGAEDGYRSWDSSFSASYSLGRNTVTALGRWAEYEPDDGAAARAGLSPPSQLWTLGGFLSLSGYVRDSLAGNYLGFAGITVYRRLTEQSLLPVDFPVYAGFSLEAGNTWMRRRDVSVDELIGAGSIFLGVDSPLGPIYLGVGLGEDSQRALYLQVGQLLD